MKESLNNKGYNDIHVRSWREQFLLIGLAEAKCLECKEKLVLEYEDLLVGSFQCPHCNYAQNTYYSELNQKAFKPKLLKQLLDMGIAKEPAYSKEELTDEKLFRELILNRHLNHWDRTDYLRGVFVLRKYTNDDLNSWRQENLNVDLVDAQCHSCGRVSRLSRYEINNGEFTCQYCNKAQWAEVVLVCWTV